MHSEQRHINPHTGVCEKNTPSEKSYGGLIVVLCVCCVFCCCFKRQRFHRFICLRCIDLFQNSVSTPLGEKKHVEIVTFRPPNHGLDCSFFILSICIMHFFVNDFHVTSYYLYIYIYIYIDHRWHESIDIYYAFPCNFII